MRTHRSVMRSLSSTMGKRARGLWSRMQAALRRFMHRTPSCDKRRAALNSQNMRPSLAGPGSPFRCAAPLEVGEGDRHPLPADYPGLNRLRRRAHEVAEAEQLRQAVTRVAAD